MSRTVVALDRVVAAVLGLVLLVGGLGALAWSQGWFAAGGRLSGWLTLSGTLALGGLPRVVRSGWWPWVAAVVGLGLLVLAFGWLVAHLPAGRLRRLTVPPPGGHGTGQDTGTGRLTADTAPIVRVAAARLERAGLISSARVRIVRDRGLLVADLDVETDANADLAALARHIDDVCAELRQLTQDGRLRARARVRVRRPVEPPEGVDRTA